MSHVLYRKYRSQTFDELVGQAHITTLLKNAISQGKVSHAYMFYGPRGLGKTSTARILAKAVNCLQLQSDGNPCGTCSSCVAIRDGSFLDLIEIDAASNRGIDQMRDLKERIEFSPTEGKKKVYIIDEVHMLTTEAFNALLKTLEEPPAHALFILATTEIHKVPATILSRCQRFDFRLGSDKQVAELLVSVAKDEGVAIDEGALKLMVENARGSYRDALSLLDVVISGQKTLGDEKRITQEEVSGALGLADSTMVYFFLEKVVNGEPSEALDLIQEVTQKGVNLGQFIKFVLSVLREILVAQMRGDVEKLEYSFAKQLSRQQTLKLINLCIEAERSLRDALVPSLPLELLVADSVDIFNSESDKDTSSRAKKTKPAPPTSSEKEPHGGNASSNHRPEETRNPSPADSKNKGNSSPVSSKEQVNSQATVQSEVTSHSEDSTLEEPSPEMSGLSETSDTISSTSSEPLTLSADELKLKWTLVLKGLRPFNSHLYAFVGRAQVRDLTAGILTIAVAFDFHKDRIESAKSKDAIAKVFHKVFGCPVKLNCVLDDAIRPSRASAELESVVIEEQPKPVSRPATNVYNSVAEVFGDELVGVA